MSATFNLRPTHKAVQAYSLALSQLANVGAKHETAVREAFHALIEHCASPLGWVLVREYTINRKPDPPIKLDGALIDPYRLVRGVIESKDNDDDLTVEIRKKIKVGYSIKNTLFWQPWRAMLMQDGKVALDVPLTDPNHVLRADNLVEVLRMFFSYVEPAISDWERAIVEFKERVPELGRSVGEMIQRARGPVPNQKFVAAFDSFTQLCRTAINPTLAESAIEEMLIQHLLTARLFATVFKNPEFTRKNVIAFEIERVIDALMSEQTRRVEFLKKLDRFYLAIESAATTIEEFSEKQKFLNTVYEKFFQGFAVKVADTMGIVYTPPSIVKFIIASVRELLRTEFRKKLGDPGVHFLDPFTGTGNFLVHLMRELPGGPGFKHKYLNELWANEIMLLPYYISALNIEHEYLETTGHYEAFPGLCLVDTFELAEPRAPQFEFMNVANTERVNRQKQAPIRVILGNPPYNAWQQDENDNNKNRKYQHLDGRIRDSYSADSIATLKNSLFDPYIKAFRWASDRLGDEGIVAYVSNNNFVNGLATDGMRKRLAEDFDAIYIVDLGGNVRKSQQGAGNVFGIRVGVCISFLVRRPQKELKRRQAQVHYLALDDDWDAARKLKWLDEKENIRAAKFRTIKPDARHTWLHSEESATFEKLIPIGSKGTKANGSTNGHSIFTTFSRGVCSNNDYLIYDFDQARLTCRAERMVEAYLEQLDRWRRAKRPENLEEFLKINPAELKWIRHTKRNLLRDLEVEFSPEKIRPSLYRPFTRRSYYFERVFNEDVYQFPIFFPKQKSSKENRVLCVTDVAGRSPFSVLVADSVVDMHLCASTDTFQCFALYTYAEDGSHRRDNVTDWALEQFKARYPKVKITKRDIFHYVYAVLHHPGYRAKFAANLRRELPRIPLAPDFSAFAKAGERLAELHTDYEQQKPYKLSRVEMKRAQLDLRVERMKLSKDKTALVYNNYLTIEGIPPEVYEYRLGNRSALEWVLDQYRVERAKDDPDKIVSDPNRADDPEYIVNLIGQVVAVSVETVKLVQSLPALE